MATVERSIGYSAGNDAAASCQAADAGDDVGDFAATDPFFALIEDWFPPGVFGKHPHRGIEIVTYVVEGRFCSNSEKPPS